LITPKKANKIGSAHEEDTEVQYIPYTFFIRSFWSLLQVLVLAIAGQAYSGK
jgi:hypothetical protein